jgi:hypothetical protein
LHSVTGALVESTARDVMNVPPRRGVSDKTLLDVMSRNFLLPWIVFPLLCAAPRVSAAQTSREANFGIVFTGGIAALPDGLSSQCGSHVNGGGGGGPEGGAALLLRLRRWIVLQMDTRVVKQLEFGCYLVGVPVDTAYPATFRRDPLATTTARLGIETPAGFPLLRASVGAGVAWGGQPLPLGVLAIAWSTRGPRARFLIEAERAQTRVRAEERHHDFTNSAVDLSRSIVLRPVYHTVRIGVELPLGSAP